jgi:hypothetical protein
VVIVSATSEPGSHGVQLLQLLGHRPAPLMIAAAGPGWHAADLPPSVHTPNTLTEALRLVREAGHRPGG